MENKINIAELLKDCPNGMELDCTMYENVTFVRVDMSRKHFPIEIAVGGIRSIYLTKEGCFHDITLSPESKCVIFPKGKTTWEGFHKPFKDGDILYVDCTDENDDDQHDYIFILNKIYNGKVYSYCYYYIPNNDFKQESGMEYLTDDKYPIRLATEEEKAKLFKAIKDNGYRWNGETKILKKLVEPKFKVGDKVKHKCDKNNTVITITGSKHDYYYIQYYNNKKNEYQNESISFTDQDKYELVIDKFDINTLKPFDKVLARHGKDNNWTATFFSHIDEKLYCHCYKFVTTNGSYPYVIPYEENKHLLGTTADCDDYYKTN